MLQVVSNLPRKSLLQKVNHFLGIYIVCMLEIFLNLSYWNQCIGRLFGIKMHIPLNRKRECNLCKLSFFVLLVCLVIKFISLQSVKYLFHLVYVICSGWTCHLPRNVLNILHLLPRD